MHYSGTALFFEPCTQMHHGTELFIVEGESAAGAVANLRDKNFQAVLAMQGKPLNAMRASYARTFAFPLYQQLVTALGVKPVNHETGEICDTSNVQFARILLLFDPDADGIHCGALTLLFFYRWMRPLLEAGRILMVRPPLYLVTERGSDAVHHAYTPDHLGRLQAQLKSQGATDIETRHHRGLAGIESHLLTRVCIAPATRKADVMGVADAEAAIAVFGH